MENIHDVASGKFKVTSPPSVSEVSSDGGEKALIDLLTEFKDQLQNNRLTQEKNKLALESQVEYDEKQDKKR